MGVFKTSLDRIVHHCHLGEPFECKAVDHTPEKIALIQAEIKKLHPNAVEVQPPTVRYNCIGFALARSHGWFNFRDRLLRDDCISVSLDSVRPADIVTYESDGFFSHIGVVTSVQQGKIERVQSKWGDWSELSHAPDDVDEHYGVLAQLFRPRAGVSPFVVTAEEETAPKDAEVKITVEEIRTLDVVSFEVKSDREMLDLNPEEQIQRSMELLSQPEVYLKVGLASTPEIARSIIKKLPGVGDLVSLGSAAAETVLQLLATAREQGNDELTSIALYLLQRIPTAAAAQLLASAIREREFTGRNMNLAADALLSSANVEAVNEDPVVAALREAERLK